MKTRTHAIGPPSNMIKLMDARGNITTVSLDNLGPCVLERYMFGSQLPSNVVLGDDEISRFRVSRMAQGGMVFKIAE